MTPGARVAAAIEIIDMINDGQPAEKALTSWARRSRFAGSKDRAAVRDHVFDVLRNWRSDACRGGGETGRQRMIGRLRAEGVDLSELFHAQGHAPAPLTDIEQAAGGAPTEPADIWDLPDWLIAEFKTSLGDGAQAAAIALKSRGPITVRVNTTTGTVDDAAAALAKVGIETAPNPVCDTALSVRSGARGLRNSDAYQDGAIELQDAASQAVVAGLPEGRKVLDYCAGGGGKALAMAAQGRVVTAHDIDFDRMADLPARARRAGAEITMLATDMLAGAGPFDVVLADAPCSGSGAWRRSAQAKWVLSRERLTQLTEIQDQVLDNAAQLVALDGLLVFATCSILKCENEDRVAAFLARHTGWICNEQTRFDLSADADGFFCAHLTRAQ